MTPADAGVVPRAIPDRLRSERSLPSPLELYDAAVVAANDLNLALFDALRRAVGDVEDGPGAALLVVTTQSHVSQLDKLAEASKANVLISRTATLDRIDRLTLAGFSDVYTMSAAGSDATEQEDPGTEVLAEHTGNTLDGLHAKLYVLEDNSVTTLVAGSTNATEAGFGGNVEFAVALTGKTVVVNQMRAEPGYDFAGPIQAEGTAGDVCDNLLTAPLRTREGKTIGVLQMFNARDEKTDAIAAFNDEVVGFVEALAAQAAVALHNKRLLEEQRILFDAFIQLIAGAIDAKSHYTGGHCARVPEVAVMLAQAVNETREGPFAPFTMSTEDQWREFNVAAWLHDCGKVTTPEYVVDNATKLETIYDRIH